MCVCMYVCESERKVLFNEQHGNRDMRGQTCHTVQARAICYIQKASSCHYVVICVTVWFVGAYEE